MTEQIKLPMKSILQIWALRDRTTNELWATPKGKATWNGRGQAKNAWNCHEGQATRYFNYQHKQWMTRKPRKFDDAVEEHNLEVVCIAEYVLR